MSGATAATLLAADRFATALLDPNPLFVELKRPVPPKGPPPKRKRPIQSASPAPGAAPAVPAPAQLQ